jgi:hypothetical protein
MVLSARMRVAMLVHGALLACVCAAALAFDPATDHTCVANCGGESAAPAPGAVSSGPSPQQIEAERRRAMEEQQRLELERRRAQEQRFNAARDAAAGELRGVATSRDGLKSADDELRDAPAANGKKTPKPKPKAAPKMQAKGAAAPPGEPTTMASIPADWNCIRPEPQDNHTWEYLQCAGSVADRGRMHCFDKRGESLKPIACFR